MAGPLLDDEQCEPGDRGGFEQAPQGNVALQLLADPRQELHPKQGVPTQQEERIVDAHLLNSQQLRPDPRDLRLKVIAGRHILSGQIWPLVQGRNLHRLVLRRLGGSLLLNPDRQRD
ncbi:hypothetical protein STIAU_5214, partial [Stigmatella aurantiaca DW4/3-1]